MDKNVRKEDLDQASSIRRRWKERLKDSPESSGSSMALPYTDRTHSRSISPVSADSTTKKTVPTLRLRLKDSDFDECVTERRDFSHRTPKKTESAAWKLPETREELMSRYSGRNRELEWSLGTGLPSYKLDAAELLLTRVAMFYGRYLKRWLRNAEAEKRRVSLRLKRPQIPSPLLLTKSHVFSPAKTVQNRLRRSCLRPSSRPVLTEGDLSFNLDNESFPLGSERVQNSPDSEAIFLLSSSQCPLGEVETPKPFNMRRSQEAGFSGCRSLKEVKKTGNVGEMNMRKRAGTEMMKTNLQNLYRNRRKVCWQILVEIHNREKSVFALVETMEKMLGTRVRDFFENELFSIPSPQYLTCKRMIIGVNYLVSALQKAALNFAFIGFQVQIWVLIKTQALEQGIEKLKDLVKSRKKEQFNRLRFFTEVLEDVRLKEYKRSLRRRSSYKLVGFLSMKLKEFKQSAFISIWRQFHLSLQSQSSSSTRNPSSSKKPNPRFLSKPAEILTKIIGKTTRKGSIFRLSRTFAVWRRIEKLPKDQSGNRLISLLLDTLLKRQIRARFLIWKNHGKRRHLKADSRHGKRRIFGRNLVGEIRRIYVRYMENVWDRLIVSRKIRRNIHKKQTFLGKKAGFLAGKSLFWALSKPWKSTLFIGFQCLRRDRDIGNRRANSMVLFAAAGMKISILIRKRNINLAYVAFARLGL